MSQFWDYRASYLVYFHETNIIIIAICSIYKIIGDRVNACTPWGTGYYTDRTGATSVSYCHTTWEDGLRVDEKEKMRRR